MKKKYKLLATSVVAMTLLSGCAHKISISPSLEDIRETKVEKKVDVNVGYYISKHNKQLKVTTPDGGGDKVEYTPYKDTEGAFNTILSKVFNRVYSLKSINDKTYIESKNIKFIFTPTITTNSSSESAFTWPPTKFTVALKCEAISLDGTKIWEETVYEEGNAEYDEFKENFSLSSQRATEKAFKNMLNKLKVSNVFKKEK
ncbi:MAG: hypothetical protein COB17_11200 [Sulfurimonas sp.]|nr:MAG: hypothetical protein COB17_11200 [Sulfurimonas sp.]